MTDTAEHSITPEIEQYRLDYEGYRAVVDELSPAYREIGIVDAGGYSRATRDPRTLTLDIAGNVQLPLLTPIEYVSGYDVERSKALTQASNVMVMSLPLAALAGQEAQIEQPAEGFEAPVILVETDHSETEDVKQVLPDLLRNLGDYEVREFLDERITKPEKQPAAMSVYTGEFSAIDEKGDLIPARGISFRQGYQELLEKEDPLTDYTKLLDVHALRENEELVDKLWDLCKDRFQWLGDYHPVSMEDTKDFFLHVVLNEKTQTINRYNENSEPGCLGFFMEGTDDCEWFSEAYREKLRREAGDRQVLFFYGLASNSQNAEHYSRDVIQLLSKVANQMGGSYLLVFESTNMSSQYIPKIVGNYVNDSDGITMTSPIKKDAQVDYWYVTPTNG